MIASLKFIVPFSIPAGLQLYAHFSPPKKMFDALEAVFVKLDSAQLDSAQAVFVKLDSAQLDSAQNELPNSNRLQPVTNGLRKYLHNVHVPQQGATTAFILTLAAVCLFIISRSPMPKSASFFIAAALTAVQIKGQKRLKTKGLKGLGLTEKELKTTAYFMKAVENLCATPLSPPLANDLALIKGSLTPRSHIHILEGSLNGPIIWGSNEAKARVIQYKAWLRLYL